MSAMQVNDKFEGTYVFDNDFPSVRSGDGDFEQLNEDDLFVAQSNRGTSQPATTTMMMTPMMTLTTMHVHVCVCVWCDQARAR
jgi:hypothetical protein